VTLIEKNSRLREAAAIQHWHFERRCRLVFGVGGEHLECSFLVPNEVPGAVDAARGERTRSR
jgi:hypothetical protein